MRYNTEFGKALHQLRDGTLSPTQFYQNHGERIRARAKYVLRHYVYSGLDEEDLVQEGFFAILKCTGTIKDPEHTDKSWDPTRNEQKWGLNEYCEWWMGRAMQSRLNKALKNPSKKKGKLPHVLIPNKALTTGISAQDSESERELFVNHPSVDSTGWDGLNSENAQHIIEYIDRSTLSVYEKRALLFASIALNRGYNLDQVYDAIESCPDSYGGMMSHHIRRLMSRVCNDRQWRQGRGFITSSAQKGNMETTDLVLGTHTDLSTIDNVDDLAALVSASWDTLTNSMFLTARLLYDIKEGELWSRGNKYTSLHDFLQNGAGLDKKISKSTGYTLISSYALTLEIAEEYDSDPATIWSKIGRTNLTLLAPVQSELRQELVEACLLGQGLSSREIERRIAESKGIDTRYEEANEAEDADIVSEEKVDRAASGDSSGHVRESTPDDMETASTITLHGKVPADSDVKIGLKKLDTWETVSGVPVERIDEVAGVLYLGHGKIALSFVPDVKEGKVLRYIGKFNETGSD